MIIYDGECYFCISTIRFLKKHLTYFPEARSSQNTPFSMSNLTEEETRKYVWYIDGFTYYKGHKALAALLVQQPEKSRVILGQLMFIPPFSWIFSIGYVIVARYRGRLSKLFFKKQMKSMCAEC